MHEQQLLAEFFETNRGRLRAVAYRMLGSVAEADDAVQETWLRLSRTDTSDVENLRAWLTTVVGRVCLNMLRPRVTVTSNASSPCSTRTSWCAPTAGRRVRVWSRWCAGPMPWPRRR